MAELPFSWCSPSGDAGHQLSRAGLIQHSDLQRLLAFLKNISLYLYLLAASVPACRIFHCITWLLIVVSRLACGMWDLSAWTRN